MSEEQLERDRQNNITRKHRLKSATSMEERKQVARVSDAQQELDVLIRARYPIIYVVTWEEERVERALRQIAASREKKLFTWTITQGIIKSGAEAQKSKSGCGNTSDPLAALDDVIHQVEPAIYLFKDFHRFTQDERANLSVIRRLRDVAFHLRDTYKTIVITSPLLQIAPELSKDITLLEFGLPEPTEFNQLLDRIIDDVKDNPKVTINLEGLSREKLLRAARGLTLREAENVFAKTLVTDGKLDADDINIVFSEKEQIIKKSGLLEYCDTKEKFNNVAGLENLKDWLSKRAIAFTDKARKFGLPSPRGVLLLGVQGCGKSLCAKSVSQLWGLPLLRFDLGRMFSSLVGSSEENVRQAIQIAESVAPVILWVDEIDKALAGSTDSAGSDGGTSARVFGTLLTWLSEKTSPVFVIATANDISHLPPELLRKGRLDEIFFIDLPNVHERRDIFKIHIARRGRDTTQFDLDKLAQVTEGFNGAEIEESIVSALFDAFSNQSKLLTEHIVQAVAETIPLSKTMSEEINGLRTWASGRARPATRGNTQTENESRRKIEF
ncbi:AAA family ATPase [Gimesia sp.]|uniref:AAA family ATPase n=1 Tax=Gimesia sp. TaxID=2024833 RepID=UPI0025C0EA79|nr:AAA family ATPase [Gimesia sp.]|tara:strand:- start:7761 stop:9425 length:1665 start_codon:yes stop_codon:yes gene_type:complete